MRYRVYSEYLRERYGEKVYKLPVSLPVTCPNRDGTCGTAGCVFCGEIGAGYENLPASLAVADQLAANIAHIAPKYKARKFIAYFQNFSNTFLPPVALAGYLDQACRPGVVGVAVATRPDCLADRHLEVLAAARAAHNVDIYLELGLQTANYRSLRKVNRGHTLAEFIDAVVRARKQGIEVCAHVIPNLPWDDMTDTVETAKVLSALGVEQVKLHALYVVKGTVLADWYERGEVNLISREEYVERVVAFLEYLHPTVVIQRLVGRAPASHTLFANWQSGWWTIRDDIEHLLEERDTRQGRLCNYLGGAAAGKFL